MVKMLLLLEMLNGLTLALCNSITLSLKLLIVNLTFFSSERIPLPAHHIRFQECH
jgi:hypothetical protein